MKNTLLLFVFLVVQACGRSDTDSGGTSTSPLVGVWKLACTQSSTSTIEATSSIFSESDTVFSDSDCKSGAMRINSAFDYVISGDATTPAGAQKLDLTISSIKVVPLTDAVASNYNQTKYCDISDWLKDTERDVTGKKCGTSATTIAAGTIIYSIFSIDSTKLTMGVESSGKDGKTDATRHSTLDTPRVYTKSL